MKASSIKLATSNRKNKETARAQTALEHKLKSPSAYRAESTLLVHATRITNKHNS